MNGSNATCLAYGQTGSGKTYTMFGPAGDVGVGVDCSGDQKPLPETAGIVPRACKELFDAVEHRRSNLNVRIDAQISISYVEIYGDRVSDLLQNRKPCGQSRVAAQRYVLDGAAAKAVGSFEEAAELLRVGEGAKRTAATAMNETSSRAHSLVILTLKQRLVGTACSNGESGTRSNEASAVGDPAGSVSANTDKERSITSRLFLADLGGSEQLKKSHAGNDRTRTQEAININLGLLALKRCAKALNAKAGDDGSRGKTIHVPYSESKLTMLLSEGLGGNSRTRVVVCAAQEPRHAAETVDAMRFGRAVGRIENKRKSEEEGEGLLRSVLDDVDGKIAECQESIRHYERWETKEVRCIDDFGEVDVRKATSLVGAESYRFELERLLRKRSELTGMAFEKEEPDSSVVGFGNAHRYGMGTKFVDENDLT